MRHFKAVYNGALQQVQQRLASKLLQVLLGDIYNTDIFKSPETTETFILWWSYGDSDTKVIEDGNECMLICFALFCLVNHFDSWFWGKKEFPFVQYIVVMYLGSIAEMLHVSAVVIFVHREWHEHRDNKIFTNVLRSQYKYIHALSLQRLTHIKTTLYSELSAWIAFK